jgi:hypothetical protein
MTKKLISIVITSLMTFPISAGAHHSFAVHFVGEELLQVSGVVTEFKFTNPHGIVRIDVTKPDGIVETWEAETNSPNALRRRGWSKDSLQMGDAITIVGFPARDGRPYLRISQVTFADGRTLRGQAAVNQD